MAKAETDDKTAVRSKFRTKDLNQAAFIWCQEGAELEKLEGTKATGTTIYFVFTLPVTDEELRKLQFEYANEKTLVEPQQFIAKQNNLRDLLHSSLGLQVTRKGEGKQT